MNKRFGILTIIWILSFAIPTVSASDSQDFICIDKTETASPPPSTLDIDKTEKIPLCPPGKVPQVANEKISTIAGRPIKGFPDHERSTDTTTCSYFGACYDWAESRQYINNLGVSAHMTQESPAVDSTYGYHSIAEIGVANTNAGSPGNYVEVGWRKAVGDVTRLFIFWWKNSDPQCYNSGCGWIQVSNYYYPGMTLSQNNYGVDYRIEYYQGNWWISYNGVQIGYYPGSLWNGQYIQANLILYYGEVASNAPKTTTDMGNGLWSSNINAARIDSEGYKNSIGSWVNANTTKWASNSDLYTVLSIYSNGMRYGGPGTGSNQVSFVVASPNGGENWVRGTTKTIRWSYTSVPGPYIKIELLKGGILNRVITYSTSTGSGGIGSYNWLIPSTQTLGSDYKIRITSTSNSAYVDISNNNFIISSPISVSVLSPNGGENWAKGTTHTITWSSVGSPGANVKIELLKAGVLNRVISSSTSNDGSYGWAIPSTQTLGNDYKIRITSTSNSAYVDISNNNFIISSPINVIIPNGGDNWIRGTTKTISWSSIGSPGTYVKIELLKAGVLNRVISSSTPNDGSYGWAIPSTQTLGSDYKIRITSTTIPVYTDTSNNNFIISG